MVPAQTQVVRSQKPSQTRFVHQTRAAATFPAFAMTAHALQGQAFTGRATVNLRLGGSSSSMGSYVALTRATKSSDLVICRPFPREVFVQGRPMGLKLLLKTWRREKIDWSKIDEQHMPSRRCQHCGLSSDQPQYMQREWATQE